MGCEYGELGPKASSGQRLCDVNLCIITVPVTEETPDTHWPMLNEYLCALSILLDLFFPALLLTG